MVKIIAENGKWGGSLIKLQSRKMASIAMFPRIPRVKLQSPKIIYSEVNFKTHLLKKESSPTGKTVISDLNL